MICVNSCFIAKAKINLSRQNGTTISGIEIRNEGHGTNIGGKSYSLFDVRFLD